MYGNSIDCQDGEIRLSGKEQLQNAGTLELCVDGLWGIVAVSKWNLAEGQVVCRQAGYTSKGMLRNQLRY